MDGDSKEYEDSWRQLQSLVRQGKSWSGNERHCIFLNTGTPTFADASAVSGLDFSDDGRGMASVDWDQDGDLDLWFTNRTRPRVRFLRNSSATANNYVAFRLRGDGGNTDAVGAEVELFFEGEDPLRHVRTLRAGSGFLSQSSKWIHFGVPEGRRISHVAVKWPAGARTEHSGVSAGARWELTEGVAAPKAWKLKRQAIALTEGPLPTTRITSSARIPIIHPMPLLGLTVEAPDGRRVTPQSYSDSGVLLTLWADWCVNCKRELAQLNKDHALLDAAGIQVVAVNLDEPDDRAAADKFLDSIGWKFERGFAHQELLDILSVSQRVLLDRPQADSIPTSYLLDGEGRLQVIYRGPVKADSLAEDTHSFDASPSERRERSARFPGWWSNDRIATRYTMMAIQLRNRGYAAISSEYLKRIGFRGDVDNAPDYAVNRMFGSEINTGIELMKTGDDQKASEAFQRALALKPESSVAHKMLGACLQRLGQAVQAREHLLRALDADPDDAEVRNDLGLTLIDLEEMEAAAEHFRASIQSEPTLAKPHYNLGIYHARKGEFDEALRLIGKAVQLKDDYVQAWVAFGNLHLIQGRPTEAIAALERALELQDSNPETYLLYGNSLIQAGRPQDARALLPKLRRLDPARAASLEESLGS